MALSGERAGRTTTSTGGQNSRGDAVVCPQADNQQPAMEPSMPLQN